MSTWHKFKVLAQRSFDPFSEGYLNLSRLQVYKNRDGSIHLTFFIGYILHFARIFLKQKLLFFPPLFKPFERFPLLVDEAKSLSTKNIADHLAYFVSSHNTLHFPLKTATLILVLTIFIHPLPSAMGPLHIPHTPD